ncbi:MAG: hypothetical protein ACW98F_09630 [Candidatus Hodarchaeales archaeon]|jgi:hypothetical protein
MKQIVIRISVIGQFNEWPYFQKFCEKSLSDSAGISVGIISRSITTDFGDFPVKFVLLFLGENIYHHIKPAHRYTIDEIFNEGLDNILNRLGRKTIINIHLNEHSSDLTA